MHAKILSPGAKMVAFLSAVAVPVHLLAQDCESLLNSSNHDFTQTNVDMALAESFVNKVCDSHLREYSEASQLSTGADFVIPADIPIPVSWKLDNASHTWKASFDWACQDLAHRKDYASHFTQTVHQANPALYNAYTTCTTRAGLHVYLSGGATDDEYVLSMRYEPLSNESVTIAQAVMPPELTVSTPLVGTHLGGGPSAATIRRTGPRGATLVLTTSNGLSRWVTVPSKPVAAPPSLPSIHQMIKEGHVFAVAFDRMGRNLVSFRQQTAILGAYTQGINAWTTYGPNAHSNNAADMADAWNPNSVLYRERQRPGNPTEIPDKNVVLLWGMPFQFTEQGEVYCIADACAPDLTGKLVGHIAVFP